jgi:hypothetical protein
MGASALDGIVQSRVKESEEALFIVDVMVQHSIFLHAQGE